MIIAIMVTPPHEPFVICGSSIRAGDYMNNQPHIAFQPAYRAGIMRRTILF